MTRASHRLALVSLLAACAFGRPEGETRADAPRPAVSARAAARPTLVVFFTIDQFRGAYLSRYGGEFTGGLKRLLAGGAIFQNGFQDHGITETAPGHAATMSGRFPVHTGIIMNSQGVNTREYPLLQAANGPGAAPFRFEGTTLTDWMVAADRSTRVLSVSRKDRGAILPIGRSKQQVFWYSSDGEFTTSTWYMEQLPEWVLGFNAENGPRKSAGQQWELLRPASQYPEPDSVPTEGRGQDYMFPHVEPADSSTAAASYPNYPAMDSLTLAFALRGMGEMQLGRGSRTDLLAISLSTLDAVGHRYGPDSREVHDHLLRLDRYLGQFLDSLFLLRDSSRIVIAMTGDHGVTPFPGVTLYDKNQGAQVVTLDPVAQEMAMRVKARGIEPAKLFAWEDGVFLVEPNFARANGIDVDSLTDAFAREARKVPGVWRADRLRDLARADTVQDAIARFDPRRSNVQLVVTLQQWSVWSLANIAMHGSPHDNDANVPVIFWGAPFAPGRYADTVRVVDMAPTLAQVIGVTPSEKLDGRPLARAIK
ncbi:MAG: alkaline phosphatase family protein [Gemmatimonadetes bacterium]|nr:alkaline phosphatase family protein [Gemmatimonadota bacterium]